MNITPQVLLKRLKPTPKFNVTEQDILALANLAILQGASAFAETWREQFAKKQIGRRSKPENAIANPHLDEAMTILKKFSSSRNLKSKEMAFLFVDFIVTSEELPRAPASAQSGIPASVRWSSKYIEPSRIPEIAKNLVEKYRAETNYTYS